MGSTKSTVERVKDVASIVFRADAGSLKDSTRFVEDLRGKSMNTIELAAMLENEFGVPVSCAVMRKSKTIGEAAELMESLLGVQGN